MAIADFLLADPEDEALWKGIIRGIPSQPDHHQRQGSLHWRSVLLEGALRACTPGAAERCLRSALLEATTAAAAVADEYGEKELMEIADAADRAVLVLTGLCRLARDPRVFTRGPSVGGVGGADSLEAWARPYFHQRDAEGYPRAALGAAGWGGTGASSSCSSSPSAWITFSPTEVEGLVKLVVLGMRGARRKGENQTQAEPVIDSGRRESKRLQIKKETVSPSKASAVSSDAASGDVVAAVAGVPVAWAWLLLSACIGKESNLTAAVEALVLARGGPDIQDGCDKEALLEVMKEEEEEEGAGSSSKPSQPTDDDRTSGIETEKDREADSIDTGTADVGIGRDDDGEGENQEEEEEEEEGLLEGEDVKDDRSGDGVESDSESGVEVEVGVDVEADVDAAEVEDGEGLEEREDGGRVAWREGRRAARAAAGYLLYQLYMAAPAVFADCVGADMHSRLMPLLIDQFVRCAPPIPSEAGPRGPGLAVAAAAHALAGVGLTAGEKGTGRKRAAASAAAYSAVLADVARRMPLVFLEQLLVLTEVLLNDAEVERSAAAAAATVSSDSFSDGGDGTGSRSSGGAPLFRSRRIGPSRLCPVPAVLRGVVGDTDARGIAEKGAKVLIHVRMWGQYFTEVAWTAVLGALRAAPGDIVGGAAGRAAGVERLLGAFLNLIAMQLMVDNGPEVASLAVELVKLLDALGDMGTTLLNAAPPSGGGPWSTARDMLASVPPVVSDA